MQQDSSNLGNIYRHIKDVGVETVKLIDDVRSGRIYPILTSSKKENTNIGGFYPGDQVIIASRTGMGKTAYIINRMTDMVDPVINPKYKDKCIILFDNWEMSDSRSLLRMVSKAEKESVKSLLDYQNKMTDLKFEAVKTAINKLSDYPIYFSNYSTNVEQWKRNKRAIQEKFPNHTIINIVDHTRLITKGDEYNEEQLITNLANAGIDVKKRYDQINIFLSQMNRNIETGNKDRTTLGSVLPVSSDIFGSDGLFQSAELVLALHRPGFYGLREFKYKGFSVETGLTDDPNSEDNLLIVCILKQRDGRLTNILLKHNLAINEIIDYDFKVRKYE